MKILNTPLYRLLAVPRNLLRRPWLLLPAAPFVVMILFIAGGCDPDCHVVIRNNYAVPITAHYVGNPARNISAHTLDTVQPGECKELSSYVGTDGDIDNIEITTANGSVLTRLNRSGKNVVCKSTTPEYLWDITVGP